MPNQREISEGLREILEKVEGGFYGGYDDVDVDEIMGDIEEVLVGVGVVVCDDIGLGVNVGVAVVPGEGAFVG